MTSCTSRMSVSWSLSNASSLAILVGDVMPFMFKVAILIEAIRLNCGGSGRGDDDGFYALSSLGCATLVLLLVRSRRIPALFSNFIFLFWYGFYLGSSTVWFSTGGCVAPSAGTASSLSTPSVLPTSVAIYCLMPSPCVFACRGRAVCLFGLSSNAAISASTVITSWGSIHVVTSAGGVLDLRLQIMPSLVSGVLLFPANI